MRILERKLIRDIGRRRLQFGGVVATIFLGVALFGASFDAYNNLKASYDELFDRTAFADITIEGGDPERVLAAVEGTAAVVASASRRVADLPLRVGDKTLLGRLVGMPAGDRPGVNDVLLLSGERPAAADVRGVLVERHMAEHFGLSAGDTIEVHVPSGWEQLSVRGVAASPEYVWPARSRQEVFTLPDQFGVVFGAESLLEALPEGLAMSQVMVRLANGNDDPTVAAALVDRALAAGAVDSFTAEEQPSNATLAEDIQGFGELSVLFPVMFLSAAALATYVLLSRMVLSQRAQIGLLLAVGFRRRRVFGHYLGFGLLTGLAGSAAGTPAGLLMAGAITRIYTGVIGIPVTVVELRPATAMMGLAFGALAGGVAAVLPAAHAVRLSPASAMSGTVASGRGSRSLFERVIPPLAGIPARWKMVLRGIGRSPVRSISTIVGVVIAVTMVLVSWAMIDTVAVLIDRQFNLAERQDATAVLPDGVDEARLQAIAGTAGVAAAEPMARLQATIQGSRDRYSTSLAAFPPHTRMHRFLDEGGATHELPREGLLVGSALQSVLGVSPGDVVRLHLPQLGMSVETVIAGFVEEPLGTPAYVSLDELERLIGVEAVAGVTREVNVAIEDGTDREVVIHRVGELEPVAAVVDGNALQRAAESLMGLFYAFVGVMLALGAVMAFAVLFNLMAANIGERVTELASLRAAGMHAAEITRMITAENVLLTLAGIAPGLVVGYLGAAEFMASFSSDLFSFELHVRPTTFLFTAAGILLAALVSQAPILRTVNGIDVARVVRERAS